MQEVQSRRSSLPHGLPEFVSYVERFEFVESSTLVKDVC